jgi:hypothetical protein
MIMYCSHSYTLSLVGCRINMLSFCQHYCQQNFKSCPFVTPLGCCVDQCGGMLVNSQPNSAPGDLGAMPASGAAEGRFPNGTRVVRGPHWSEGSGSKDIDGGPG